MNRRPNISRLPLMLGSLLPCCFGVIHAVAQQSSPDDEMYHLFGLDTLADDDWSRHFSIGGIAGLNIHGSFGMSGAFNINGHNPASGIYDDGFVREDNTGNAGGYTGYWGYDNASQYNAAQQTLTFHSASTYSSTTPESASVNDPIEAGFELKYGDTEFTWKQAKVGWEFGFGLLPITIADHTPVSVNVNQTSYTFSTANLLVMPGPGYAGSPGGFGEPPISSTYQQGTNTTSTGLVTGERSLHTMLYTARLGPWIDWSINQEMELTLGAGPAIGLAQNTLSYNETITYDDSQAVNNGRVTSFSFVYGGYVNGTLVFHAPEKADLFIGGEYMPLSDVNISGGGRHARLDLSGQIYITAGVNWSF